MAFRRQIGLSSTRHEEDVILEPCSKGERDNMVIMDGSLIAYFYFHLLVIYDLGVLIPFTLLRAEFLTTALSPLSKSSPMFGVLLGPLELCVTR